MRLFFQKVVEAMKTTRPAFKDSQIMGGVPGSAYVVKHVHDFQAKKDAEEKVEEMARNGIKAHIVTVHMGETAHPSAPDTFRVMEEIPRPGVRL